MLIFTLAAIAWLIVIALVMRWQKRRATRGTSGSYSSADSGGYDSGGDTSLLFHGVGSHHGAPDHSGFSGDPTASDSAGGDSSGGDSGGGGDSSGGGD